MVGCAGESEDTNDSGGVGDGKITVNSKDANAAPVDRIQYVPVMHLREFSSCSTFKFCSMSCCFEDILQGYHYGTINQAILSVQRTDGGMQEGKKDKVQLALAHVRVEGGRLDGWDRVSLDCSCNHFLIGEDKKERNADP